ncbi:hypothetical protein ACLQ3C_11855 [Gordonia sp. DT30]|uniref:hypothetical protein n=1 Tax=Gordonia sp. DT30 TaxID=3416546 RepID=UPI003CF9DCF5
MLAACAATLFAGDVAVTVAATIFMVVFMAFFGCLMVGTIMLVSRSRMRRLVPAGTPMSAEFTPLWIGHRVGATYSVIPLERFDRVVAGPTVVMLCTRRRPVVLLPRELVPPQVIADYESRYGRSGRPGR